MNEHWDLVVVGAGFAGLACAKRAAECGLAALVIERQASPGRNIHTTGILVKEAQAEWSAPAELVRRIKRVRLYTPSGRHIELQQEGYHFLATDTQRLMNYLTDEVRRAGATVRFSCEFGGMARRGAHIRLAGHGITCKFLVGADGVFSKVAQAAHLDQNTRLLKGVEWAYDPIDSVGDCLHCFVDPKLAPGYIGWVVPGVGVTQVGLAVNQRHHANIERFTSHLNQEFGLADRQVVEKRGGMIPINGLLRRIHSGNVLLIGDAAGMVSPLTAGGIYKSYRYGKLAGDAIAAHLLQHAVNPGDVVRAPYKGDTWKHVARWCFDNLPIAKGLDLGMGTSNLLKRLSGKIFFNKFTTH